MSRYDWEEWERYPTSLPRRTRDGIRARSKRGSFGEHWWSKRWLAVLEGLGLGGRLNRGKSYARQGQVLEIDIEPGSVKARVQGSRVRPYKVSIKLARWSDETRARALAALTAESGPMAKLLNGELPPEAEEILSRVEAPLFPKRRSDLETECSCPDWSNPCKHIAAVFFLVGEELDRDPLLLLKLRGLPREDLLPAMQTALPSEPLPAEPSAFWNGSEPSAAEPSPPPPVRASIPKRLGPFPFWPGETPFLEIMEGIYRSVAEGPLGKPEETSETVFAAERKTSGSRKSRDRAALARDLNAGMEEAELRIRYDGRILRYMLNGRTSNGRTRSQS